MNYWSAEALLEVESRVEISQSAGVVELIKIRKTEKFIRVGHLNKIFQRQMDRQKNRLSQAWISLLEHRMVRSFQNYPRDFDAETFRQNEWLELRYSQSNEWSQSHYAGHNWAYLTSCWRHILRCLARMWSPKDR